MMQRKQPNLPAEASRQAGFSLLEMMVVVLLILLLSGIAIPALLRAIRSYRTESTARGVANMLQRARYEAVNRNRRISTLFVPPAAGEGVRYGIDVDGSGVLDAGEPRIMAASGVNFWRNNIPAPPPTTNLPADYAILGLPLNYSVTFSPQGTVVTQIGGVWRLAPQVQGITFIRGPVDAMGNPTDPRHFEAWLVAITPAGAVRIWRWSIGAGWQ